MSIQLTERAAEHVRRHLETTQALGIRLATKKSGCSGFAYDVDYAKEAREGDLEYESHGVRLFVDADSLPLLQGMTIDYTTQNLNQNFEFINPNVTNQCGCGESFSVS